MKVYPQLRKILIIITKICKAHGPFLSGPKRICWTPHHWSMGLLSWRDSNENFGINFLLQLNCKDILFAHTMELDKPPLLPSSPRQIRFSQPCRWRHHWSYVLKFPYLKLHSQLSFHHFHPNSIQKLLILLRPPLFSPFVLTLVPHSPPPLPLTLPSATTGRISNAGTPRFLITVTMKKRKNCCWRRLLMRLKILRF